MRLEKFLQLTFYNTSFLYETIKKNNEYVQQFLALKERYLVTKSVFIYKLIYRFIWIGLKVDIKLVFLISRNSLTIDRLERDI